jgi:hypothetical protein
MGGDPQVDTSNCIFRRLLFLLYVVGCYNMNSYVSNLGIAETLIYLAAEY